MSKPKTFITAILAVVAILIVGVHPASAVSTATVVRATSLSISDQSTVFQRVTVDSNGNQYVSGLNGSEMLLAKYDTSGASVWQKSFATSGETQIANLAVNPSGELVVVGYFQVSLDLGGSLGTQTAIGTIDAFVLKLSSEGTILGFRDVGQASQGVAIVAALDLGISQDGNIYLDTYFSDSVGAGVAGIDGIHWSSTSNQRGWIDGPVILKLDNDLNVVRATPLPIGFINYGFGGGGFAVSPHGKVAIGGSFEVATDFGNHGVITPSRLDCVWMEFDAQGDVDKFQTFEGSNSDAINKMSYDSDENIYVLGESYESIVISGESVPLQGSKTSFVAKFSSSSSSLVWLQKWGASDYGETSAQDLGVDSAGNVAVSGSTYALNLVLGSLPTSSSDGSGKLYNLGINSDGTFAWIKFASSSSQNASIYQGALFDGILFTVGHFADTGDFGDGQVISAATNQWDAFLYKTNISWDNTTPLDPAHSYGSLDQFGGSQERPSRSLPALPVIQVGSISPRVLDATAGGTVTVTASNASKVTSVKLGNLSLPFKILSTDQFQVTLPAHEVGYADLTFTTSEGKVPLSNAVRYSDILNTHLAVITLVNPTKTALARAQAKFVKITYTDRVVTKGKKPKITITLTGRIKN